MKRRNFSKLLAGSLSGITILDKISTPNSKHTVSWTYNDMKREITVTFSETPRLYEIGRNHLNSIYYSQDMSSINKIGSYILNHHDSKMEALKEMVHFVQNEIEYERDINSSGLPEYPRYAPETIIAGLGDCIDKSILLSALAESINIRTAFIFPKGHAAILVPKKYSELRYNDPEIITLEETKFVYVETTSDLAIGVYPENWLDKELMGILDQNTNSFYSLNTTTIFESGSDAVIEYIQMKTL